MVCLGSSLSMSPPLPHSPPPRVWQSCLTCWDSVYPSHCVSLAHWKLSMLLCWASYLLWWCSQRFWSLCLGKCSLPPSLPPSFPLLPPLSLFLYATHSPPLYSAKYLKGFARHSALKGITTLSLFVYKYVADTSFIFLSCVTTDLGFVSHMMFRVWCVWILQSDLETCNSAIQLEFYNHIEFKPGLKATELCLPPRRKFSKSGGDSYRV